MGMQSLPPEVLALVLAHVAGGAVASRVLSDVASITSRAQASGLNAWLKHLRAVCTSWRNEIDELVTGLNVKVSKKRPRKYRPLSRFRGLSSLTVEGGVAAPEMLLECAIGCTTLRSLTFTHNIQVYPHIGRLTTLTHLTVNCVDRKTHCRQLETSLRQLTALQSLSIHGTVHEANPCLRVALANMPALRSLEIVTKPYPYQLRDAGFWELATGLTALRLSQYDTCIVRGLSQLQQLQHLRIEMMQRGREVKIEGVHRLAKLSCLEVIFPGATESAWLMDQDLSDFGKCTALTKLKMLGFSHVYQEHDELLRGLSSLRHLASLSIGASAPEGNWTLSETACPDSIADLTALTALHMEQYGSVPRTLTRLTRLRWLSVQRIAFCEFSDWDIIKWANKLHGLQHLDVDIPDTSWHGRSGVCCRGGGALDHLTSLQSLSIACSLYNTVHLGKALLKLTGLTRLSVQLASGSSGFSCHDLQHLWILTRLRSLTLSSSKKDFTALPDACFYTLTQLTELSLAGCASFVQLPESISYLRALRTLNLDGCLSLEELPAWLSDLRALEQLTCRIEQTWVLALKRVAWRELMSMPMLWRVVLPAGLRKFGGVAADVADEYALQHVVEWV